MQTDPHFLPRLVHSTLHYSRRYFVIAAIVGVLVFAGEFAVFQVRDDFVAYAEVDIGGISLTRPSTRPSFDLIEPLAKTHSFFEKNAPALVGAEVAEKCTIEDGLRGSKIEGSAFRDEYYIIVICKATSGEIAKKHSSRMASILQERHDELFELEENAYRRELESIENRLNLARRQLEVADDYVEDNQKEYAHVIKLYANQELADIEEERAILENYRSITKTKFDEDNIVVIDRSSDLIQYLVMILVSLSASAATLLLLAWGAMLQTPKAKK